MTFTAQVFFAPIIGAFLLVSRYANTSEGRYVGESLVGKDLPEKIWSLAELVWNKAWAGELFSDTGQILIIVCWLILLGVTAMPILLKLLPLVPRPLRHRDPVSYLREVLPDGS